MVESLYQKSNDNNKIKLECSNCPNSFECPFKGMSEFHKNQVCLVKRSSLYFSEEKNWIVVPEETEIWNERLQEFFDLHLQ